MVTMSFYVPWQRPGFDIGLRIESLIRDHSKAKGVLLGHHGMSSWSNDDRVCYETALEIINRAARYIAQSDRGEMTFGGPKHAPLPDPERHRILIEILPWLRGQVSVNKRFVATVQDDPGMLRFTPDSARWASDAAYLKMGKYLNLVARAASGTRQWSKGRTLLLALLLDRRWADPFESMGGS